ncbi:dendritic cell-specific transmembrane protein-like [Salminus brasiliensis]|uniref:dendritic cell-specific transmembrane protein-like n=1 Tax=Salminus brasiliensis TaxID=930266 RepID=UPI003B82F6D7
MGDGFKQKLVQTWTTVVMLYTTGQRDGWKHTLLHSFTCLFMSLVISSLLFLTLHAVTTDLQLASLVATGCVLFLTIALFLSERVRCFILLLIISCSMKQSRNVLLITGTGLVTCLSIQNTYRNLRKVSQSIECNLKKKKDLLEIMPIMNYIKMIKRVKEQLKTFSNMHIVKFKADLNIWSTLDSDELREKLQRAETELRNKADRAEAVFDLVMSVFKKVAPVLGIILLVGFTTYFLRKYMHDNRYKNIYITSKFEEYDERQKAKGKPHVLPLTKKEASQYISIPSAKPKLRECLPAALFFLPVGSSITWWFIVIGLDWLLCWIISVINEQLMDVKPFYVPLKINVNEKMNLFSFNMGEKSKSTDFSYSVNVSESECVPEPTLLLSQSVVPLSVIIGVLLILGLLTSKMLQVKLLATEQFFAKNTEKRVKYLHTKILSKRSLQKNFTAPDLKKDRQALEGSTVVVVGLPTLIMYMDDMAWTNAGDQDQQ